MKETVDRDKRSALGLLDNDPVISSAFFFLLRTVAWDRDCIQVSKAGGETSCNFTPEDGGGQGCADVDRFRRPLAT